MTTLALDTNIVSYILKGIPDVFSRIRDALSHRDNIIIPPFVYYEIRRGFHHCYAPGKERTFNYLCSLYPVGEMTTAAWEHAARLYAVTRKSGRPIHDADLIIAAFCIVNGYKLVTANIRHFECIEGLQMINWIE